MIRLKGETKRGGLLASTYTKIKVQNRSLEVHKSGGFVQDDRLYFARIIVDDIVRKKGSTRAKLIQALEQSRALCVKHLGQPLYEHLPLQEQIEEIDALLELIPAPEEK